MTSSPTEKLPSSSVPVTTVPNPERLKTRSAGSRGRPRSRFGGVSARIRSRATCSSASPLPVRAETRTTGASASVVGATSSRASISTRSNQSGSGARSILVRTTIPRRISSRSKMARCSRVWGETPSSAAITSSTASMPPMPESILPMKSRWPGTSIMPICSPLGSVRSAKPRSMVISRAISSFSRSG